MKDLFEAIEDNKRKSLLFLFSLFVLLITAIHVFCWTFELPLWLEVIADIIVVLFLLFTYKKGDSVVLKSVGAQPLDKHKYRWVYNIVEGLAIAAEIPPPQLWVIKSEAYNAFATGTNPSHAHIVFTSALLNTLTKDEVAAVAAHEISHIARNDVEMMTLAASTLGLITFLSYLYFRLANAFFSTVRHSRNKRSAGELLLIFIVGSLAFMAIDFVGLITLYALSREREYLADATAVKLTRYPQALISALKKISKNSKMEVPAGVSHLFIDEPLEGFMASLFSTHPPIEKRIERLKQLI